MHGTTSSRRLREAVVSHCRRLRFHQPPHLLLIGLILLFAVSGELLERDASSAASGIAGSEGVTALPPRAMTTTESVTITVDQLSYMMETDVAAQRDYLTWMKRTGGEAAQRQAEQSIRSPYQRRIAEIKATGENSVVQPIPVLTVGGAVTFSTMSFNGALRPKDPVSILFYGDASAHRVYDSMMSMSAGSRFEDADGRKGWTMNTRGYQCHSEAQWVLMGNVGDGLEWRRSDYGLMRSGERCVDGVRDHMRLFGSESHPDLGEWSVATPHRERWAPMSQTQGDMGHRVESWTAARDAFSDFWTAADREASTANAEADAFDWGNSGVFQSVGHDGRGFVINVCSCRSTLFGARR